MIGACQAGSQGLVNRALDTLVTGPRPEQARLYGGMRYSVMNGGQRVRPLLAYAACEALGGAPEQANGAACAVELIHAYSLVHDDLPAMDDDDLRRGQPTTHKKFDEACARSEEHTSELQSLMRISYAVFCLKKKNNKNRTYTTTATYSTTA